LYGHRKLVLQSLRADHRHWYGETRESSNRILPSTACASETMESPSYDVSCRFGILARDYAVLLDCARCKVTRFRCDCLRPRALRFADAAIAIVHDGCTAVTKSGRSRTMISLDCHRLPGRSSSHPPGLSESRRCTPSFHSCFSYFRRSEQPEILFDSSALSSTDLVGPIVLCNCWPIIGSSILRYRDTPA